MKKSFGDMVRDGLKKRDEEVPLSGIHHKRRYGWGKKN